MNMDISISQCNFIVCVDSWTHHQNQDRELSIATKIPLTTSLHNHTFPLFLFLVPDSHNHQSLFHCYTWITSEVLISVSTYYDTF